VLFRKSPKPTEIITLSNPTTNQVFTTTLENKKNLQAYRNGTYTITTGSKALQNFYGHYAIIKVLSVKSGIAKPTDRDNFKYKRIELVGPLLYNLLNEYYKIQVKSIQLGFEQTLYYNKGQYESNLSGLYSTGFVNVWKHIAFTINGKKLTFYENGVEISSITMAETLSHVPKILNDINDTKFIGKILAIPGCQNKLSSDEENSDNIKNELQSIYRRFCGGVFFGDKQSLEVFYDLYVENFPYQTLLKARVIFHATVDQRSEIREGGLSFKCTNSHSLLSVLEETV
jgi:hypothetical protein